MAPTSKDAQLRASPATLRCSRRSGIERFTGGAPQQRIGTWKIRQASARKITQIVVENFDAETGEMQARLAA
jgi:hypothetical protein